MHTVEEARTKWCPLRGVAVNFAEISYNEKNCVADQCAWWVWGRDFHFCDNCNERFVPVHDKGRCGMVKV